MKTMKSMKIQRTKNKKIQTIIAKVDLKLCTLSKQDLLVRALESILLSMIFDFPISFDSTEVLDIFYVEESIVMKCQLFFKHLKIA